MLRQVYQTSGNKRYRSGVVNSDTKPFVGSPGGRGRGSPRPGERDYLRQRTTRGYGDDVQVHRVGLVVDHDKTYLREVHGPFPQCPP